MYDEICDELDLEIVRILEMLDMTREDVHSTITPEDAYEARSARIDQLSQFSLIGELERELDELYEYRSRIQDVE